jgi:hypothetical protein
MCSLNSFSPTVVASLTCASCFLASEAPIPIVEVFPKLSSILCHRQSNVYTIICNPTPLLPSLRATHAIPASHPKRDNILTLRCQYLIANISTTQASQTPKHRTLDKGASTQTPPFQLPKSPIHMP